MIKMIINIAYYMCLTYLKCQKQGIREKLIETTYYYINQKYHEITHEITDVVIQPKPVFPPILWFYLLAPP